LEIEAGYLQEDDHGASALREATAMSPASIALNRFGYGLAQRQTPPVDPRGYLLHQIDAFDPAPAPIASRTSTRAKSAEMINLLRMVRQEKNSTAADTAPAMGESMAAANPRAAALAGLPPEYRETFRAAGQVLIEDIAARTRTVVASDTPMIERLVHFWSNHFSVSAGKLGTQFEVGPHEFAAIRPHVLGRFADLLKAAVLHPAMLLYLDQFQSIGPNAPAAQRFARRGDEAQQRPRGLNENLAREVLELHTLGVGGGYAQADVTELARALTGWTIPGIGRVGRFAEDQPGGAAFVALAHEPGARLVLGRRYGAGGADQALAILDDLAAHPATARHIAAKLARHFAGDTPPPALVARLENDFLRSGGDLARLTRTLIEAPEVWVAGPVKFRTPFEWLVAVLRLTGTQLAEPRRLTGALAELGQVPWRAPSPAGYDDLAATWLAPDALIKRVEVAERIARNARLEDVTARAADAFPGALSEATRTQLARADSGQQALALLLASPEMMRR
jgi:uncharacterized protein (DUF1800 family)